MNFDDVMLNALLNRQMGMGVQVFADGTEMIAPEPDVTEQMTVGTLPDYQTKLPLSTFGKMAADVPAGLLKGAATGTAGLAGDIIAFGSGIAAAINPREGESRVDAFLRAVGDPVEVFGYDITTEGLAEIIDRTIGPLVPESDTDAVRRKAAKTTETVGELFGAGKTIMEIGKGTAKTVQRLTKKKAAAATAAGASIPASAEIKKEQK